MTEPTPDLDRPAFRAVDMFPAEQDGVRGLVLVDRSGISQDPTFLPEGLLPLVGLFDGHRTLAQIRAELAKTTGQVIPEDAVTGIVAQLDERLVLLSPRYQRALTEATSAFLANSTRPARHAGSAGYPATAGALREALESMVGATRQSLRPAPRALIAPHIDLVRGREGYAQAYGYLAECEPAELYVVFGTGHQGPSAPLTGLAMDWDTPLGPLTTDREFLAAVEAELGAPRSDDLFLHRDEHSLEFQTVFLRYLAGDRPLPEIACFLCGPLPSADGDPGGEDYAARLLAAFRAAEASSGRRTCYIAGADLAHLGPFFGDHQPVAPERLQQLRDDELSRLGHLEAGAPGAFHRSVVADGNADRVCGATPIYLASSLAGGAGELLHYGQAPADDGSQVVSFCSMAFAGE